MRRPPTRSTRRHSASRRSRRSGVEGRQQTSGAVDDDDIVGARPRRAACGAGRRGRQRARRPRRRRARGLAGVRRRRRWPPVRSGPTSPRRCREPGSSTPICSTRSPIRTPLIVTASGSRRRSTYAKTCAFPHDIVADCDSTTRHCPCARQARRAARRPRRRQHDDHRRRDGDPERPGAADRLADPDGHDPPRQAHRGARAEDQGLRAARRPQRHRVRRLGHLRGGLLRRGAHRRRARAVSARSGSRRARGRQADAGGVRPALRQAARRPERQEGQEQAGPGRAARSPTSGRSRRRTAATAW